MSSSPRALPPLGTREQLETLCAESLLLVRLGSAAIATVASIIAAVQKLLQVEERWQVAATMLRHGLLDRGDGYHRELLAKVLQAQQPVHAADLDGTFHAVIQGQLLGLCRCIS